MSGPSALHHNRGFNLIEIAIVLAVIGLVIGGIYTAASAVTENNRKQTTQKQVLQIIQNIRSAYVSQASFQVPSYAEIKAMKLFPGDITDTGTGFLDAYGEPIYLLVGTMPQAFIIWADLSKEGCIDLLTKGFGSAQIVTQAGLINAGGNGVWLDTAVADGISPAEALTSCSGSATSFVATHLQFNLRG